LHNFEALAGSPNPLTTTKYDAPQKLN